MSWYNVTSISSISYMCGYCNNSLASDRGYLGNTLGKIVICHHCSKPTYFDSRNNQTPGVSYGIQVNNINDEQVEILLLEARNCFSVNAFTASVLCCRKILMHVAVDKGAAQGLSFVKYVEYLSDQNFIPAGSKGWVDYIRTKSNELNHEIILGSNEDASKLLDFTCMLLKVIYEFPSSIPKPC